MTKLELQFHKLLPQNLCQVNETCIYPMNCYVQLKFHDPLEKNYIHQWKGTTVILTGILYKLCRNSIVSKCSQIPLKQNSNKLK